MKILTSLLVIPIILACYSCNNESRYHKNLKDKSINEDIEWSNSWIVSVNKHDLPKVLIIGDSHVERYYPTVAERLRSQASCSKLTTSRSLGDPALIEQLRAIFFSLKFDVICFNNGLHGVDYTDEQYSRYIPEVYKLISESNSGVKLIWVNTTCRRIRDNISSFDEYNQGVINRNKAVENFSKSNNIPLIDFYALSLSHPEYYEADGIHFNKEGVEVEARYIYEEILNVIENFNVKSK